LANSTSECEAAPANSTTVKNKSKDGTKWAKESNASRSGGLKLFTGNSNKPLAEDIAKHLGMKLGKMTVDNFADGECNVMINENVRGKDVYIIQPTSPPVNETLMELLLMISTMRRASARKITAIIPYYGYARQDRKMQARVPISAADVSRLLESMGVDRVVAVDLHCGQIQGFFGPRVPVDNLDGGTVGVTYFGDMDLVNPVIVSPDAGGVYRAKQFREALSKKHDMDCGLAMIIKQRAKANEIDRMDLVGAVDGCDVIIVDDMVDTAGTLCKAAQVLKDHGARNVYAFASHGVFSGPAPTRIANSVLTELVVLDTVPLSPESLATGKITQLSVGPLLAQAIYNIHYKKSISALFK
jgi:ribose-phosphate pyrophosphokinase